MRLPRPRGPSRTSRCRSRRSSVLQKPRRARRERESGDLVQRRRVLLSADLDRAVGDILDPRFAFGKQRQPAPRRREEGRARARPSGPRRSARRTTRPRSAFRPSRTRSSRRPCRPPCGSLLNRRLQIVVSRRVDLDGDAGPCPRRSATGSLGPRPRSLNAKKLWCAPSGVSQIASTPALLPARSIA